MVEPVTTGVGLGFLGGFLNHCFEAAYGHPIGHQSTHALHHLIGHLNERLHDGELPANHDLRAAVEESLMEASRAFALGVAAHLDPQPPLLEAIRRHLHDGTFSKTPLLKMRKVPGREWVKELVDESHHAHKKTGGIAADFILREEQVTTVLLERAPDGFQCRVHSAFADWLKRHIQHPDRPDCVADFLGKR